jgi:superfamily II DNA helicase RecQ
MNKNLYVTVSREKGNSKYDSLIKYLNEPQIMRCRGILVYARTKKIMYEVFNYITNSTSQPTRIYHGGLTNKEKTETLTKFREGEIKVVIATIALGMGLDFSHLECVIHINMPKSVENYVQEIGRAGRRERRAYCHLFLDDLDYITERNYIIADQLEPDTLLALY